MNETNGNIQLGNVRNIWEIRFTNYETDLLRVPESKVFPLLQLQTISLEPISDRQ